jgi:hypothetical protein
MSKQGSSRGGMLPGEGGVAPTASLASKGTTSSEDCEGYVVVATNDMWFCIIGSFFATTDP